MRNVVWWRLYVYALLGCLFLVVAVPFAVESQGIVQNDLRVPNQPADGKDLPRRRDTVDRIVDSATIPLHSTTHPKGKQRLLSSSFSGNITALVLLVRFPEDVNVTTLPSREYFHRLCNQDMATYLTAQSSGRYSVVCDVRDWRTTEHAAHVYAQSVANLLGRTGASRFFAPILHQWDGGSDSHSLRTSGQSIIPNSTASLIVDWSVYDSNGDGLIDALLVWHSGYAAEDRLDGSECGTRPYMDRIHSQGHMNVDEYSDENENNSLFTDWTGSVSVSGYATASAWDLVCTDRPATMGTMTHEWMHILGAYDTYGSSSGDNTPIIWGGLGNFDLMARTRGPTNTGIPASLSAYSKHTIGWLNYTDVITNGIYTLNASNHGEVPAAACITAGYGTNEYILLEYRRPVTYDANLFGGGLLLYHVDDDVRPRRYNQTTFRAKHHHRIALLPADGRYDLERGVNYGDAGDFWTERMVLGPSDKSRETTTAGDDVPGLPLPNTDSYESGPTGIIIIVLEIAESHVAFRVEGLVDNNGSHNDIATTLVTPSPAISFAVNGSGGATSNVPSAVAVTDTPTSNLPSDQPSLVPSVVPSRASSPSRSRTKNHDKIPNATSTIKSLVLLSGEQSASPKRRCTTYGLIFAFVFQVLIPLIPVVLTHR